MSLAACYLGTLAFVAFVLRLRRETTPAERPDLLAAIRRNEQRVDELVSISADAARMVRDLAETVSELSLKSIGRPK